MGTLTYCLPVSSTVQPCDADLDLVEAVGDCLAGRPLLLLQLQHLLQQVLISIYCCRLFKYFLILTCFGGIFSLTLPPKSVSYPTTHSCSFSLTSFMVLLNSFLLGSRDEAVGATRRTPDTWAKIYTMYIVHVWIAKMYIWWNFYDYLNLIGVSVRWGEEWCVDIVHMSTIQRVIWKSFLSVSPSVTSQ